MFKTIAADEFYQLEKKEGLTILDVRERDEFARGHIPFADSLPLSGLTQSIPLLDESQEYHVICQAGGRSAQACELLSQAGYQVVNVLGGMSVWKGEVVQGDGGNM